MMEVKQPFSLTKTTNFTTGLGPSTISFSQENCPQDPETFIIQNPEYNKLYKQLFKNNQKINHVVDSTKQKQEQCRIKSFMSKSLDLRKKGEQFEDKFKDEVKLHNHKRSPMLTVMNKMNTIITQKIGETQQSKIEKEKSMFFSRNKKVLQLQQECLLLEYYYKDRSQFIPKSTTKKPSTAPNISYLRTRNHSEARHKRIQPNPKQFQKLFLTHDEQYFQRIKRINYIKEEKFKNSSYKRAEMNYQFKREKNFAQMAEITRQNRNNLLVESKMNQPISEVKEKEQKFNRVMRFFLKFAYIEQSKRAYFEYIELEGIQRLVRFICGEGNNQYSQFDPQLKEDLIREIIHKITRYKQEVRLQFYDFMEFLETIQQTFQIDLLHIVQQKYPSYFLKPEEKILKQNWTQIKKEINSKKVKFTLKLMFDSCGAKLDLGQFMPIKQVPRILSNVGITGNDIPRTKLFEFMYWNQHRPQGLNFKEFYFAFLMIGVKNETYDNVFKLIEKVKVKELLV